MTYSAVYKSGNAVLPAALFLHVREIFGSGKDFLVWQFFYLEDTTKQRGFSFSLISNSLGMTEEEVGKSMDRLVERGLLQYKNGGFNSFPALDKLEELIEPQKPSFTTPQNDFKELVETFQKELGRFLTPFEIEELTKTVQEDRTSPELIKEALREAVFNGKSNWKYIQAILRNWRREGITSPLQVQAKRKEREEETPTNVEISDDFLNAMNLWKD